MDTDKIIQDLNRRFAVFLPEFYQRRIIFWYDEDKEFEDKLDEVVLENAKVIELTGNNVFCRNLYEARRTNDVGRILRTFKIKKNVEFKENLLEKSIKYMKSVVAFVNGTGGKIIFGIANKTREIVGFDKEDVFKKMDAIANAVSDSCEPAIISDSTLQTVDGKTVIVVEIFEGRQQLRSWGILFERDGKDYPSNAFAILAGNGGLYVATQVSCGE